MNMLATRLSALSIGLIGCSLLTLSLQTAADNSAVLDQRLAAVLAQQGFTGRIESTLAHRLGRHRHPE
jgi:hypothetical protein